MINAVKAETLSELRNILFEKRELIENVSLDEISVSSVKEPENDKDAPFSKNNPIYIVSFEILPVKND